MEQKRKEKSAAGRKILALVIAAVILAGAVALFVFRDRIADSLGLSADPARGESWAYESGSSQTFARAGNGLAVASSTGLQLLGADGYTICRHVCALSTPAVAACQSGAAAYDIGGTVLRFSDMEGKVTELDTSGAIIAVTLSEGGYLAVSSEAPGCRGMVRVYDPALTAVYEWYSGTGYLLSAQVSPDGKLLAVLTAAADGGHVRIFSLGSEAEQASFTAADELLIDLKWLSDGRLCALSESRAVMLDSSGSVRGEYGFGGLYLTDYSLEGDGFAALALSKYLSGSAGLIVTVGDGGEVLGELAPESELKSLDAGGRQVAALYSDGAEVYSMSLSRQGRTEDTRGVKSILLRKKGDAALLYTASALIVSL